MGGLGDVGEVERPFAVCANGQIVAKQSRRRRTAGRARPERAALDKEDVEIAVVVVVEQRNAAAHDFGKIELSGGAVDVGEDETGLGGGLDENWRCRRRRPGGDGSVNDENRGRDDVDGPKTVPCNLRSHFNAARSRSIAAARSCCPYSSARFLASVAHLIPSRV